MSKLLEISASLVSVLKRETGATFEDEALALTIVNDTLYRIVYNPMGEDFKALDPEETGGAMDAFKNPSGDELLVVAASVYHDDDEKIALRFYHSEDFKSWQGLEWFRKDQYRGIVKTYQFANNGEPIMGVYEVEIPMKHLIDKGIDLDKVEIIKCYPF